MKEPSLKVEGPGYWHLIHSQTADIDSELLSLSTINWLKDNFFCRHVCREHMRDYIRKYNPSSLLYQYDIIDGERVPKLFSWGVILHNEVNRSRGKKEYTVSESYRRYRKRGDDEPCSSDCSEAIYEPVTGPRKKSPKLRISRFS
jgi:hypothetical protein